MTVVRFCGVICRGAQARQAAVAGALLPALPGGLPATEAYSAAIRAQPWPQALQLLHTSAEVLGQSLRACGRIFSTVFQ